MQTAWDVRIQCGRNIIHALPFLLVVRILCVGYEMLYESTVQDVAKKKLQRICSCCMVRNNEAVTNSSWKDPSATVRLLAEEDTAFLCSKTIATSRDLLVQVYSRCRYIPHQVATLSHFSVKNSLNPCCTSLTLPGLFKLP